MTSNSFSTCTAAQEQRVLDALRTGPQTTVALRKNADILHPAGRVQALRERGHDILTQWAKEPTDSGVLHRVARYVLLASPAGENSF